MDVNSGYLTGVSLATAQANGWLLKDSSGNYITRSGGNYLADVGSSGYQQAWINGVIGMIQRYGVKGNFIDNVLVNYQGYSWSGSSVKYPTVASWKAAMASFVQAVGPALKAQGFHVTINETAYSSGDSGSDNGTSDIAWAQQLAPSVNAIMHEYFEQNPNTLGLRAEGSSWDQHYASWLNLIDAVQNAGADFVSANNSASKDDHVARYCKASFLLGWNGDGGAVSYHPNDGSDPWSTSWTTNIGRPIEARFQIGPVWVRHYTHGKVLVNPTTTSQTVSVDGTTYTLPATDAVIVQS
jgi:hypothetical protein